MEDRKKDHIDMAFSSRLDVSQVDKRFEYEPLLGSHTDKPQIYNLANKQLRLPLWVSSMTGGTSRAGLINKNLAQACAEFGMGMGLGSCRILLDDRTYFNDFNVRPIMGNEVPLFANIGICQLEQLLASKEVDKLNELVANLQADGLIIHINPLQESFQPEGDRLKRPAIEILEDYLEQTNILTMVKEVGQGMGKDSLKALLQLPLESIEFGAFGGTNFSYLELNRSNSMAAEVFRPFINVGHTAEEMTLRCNELIVSLGAEKVKTKNIIISGGISSLLDGYYLTSISSLPAIYGMGSAFLRHSMGSYSKLQQFMQELSYGHHLASNFLRVKHPNS